MPDVTGAYRRRAIVARSRLVRPKPVGFAPPAEAPADASIWLRCQLALAAIGAITVNGSTVAADKLRSRALRRPVNVPLVGRSNDNGQSYLVLGRWTRYLPRISPDACVTAAQNTALFIDGLVKGRSIWNDVGVHDTIVAQLGVHRRAALDERTRAVSRRSYVKKLVDSFSVKELASYLMSTAARQVAARRNWTKDTGVGIDDADFIDGLARRTSGRPVQRLVREYEAAAAKRAAKRARRAATDPEQRYDIECSAPGVTWTTTVTVGDFIAKCLRRLGTKTRLRCVVPSQPADGVQYVREIVHELTGHRSTSTVINSVMESFVTRAMSDEEFDDFSGNHNASVEKARAERQARFDRVTALRQSAFNDARSQWLAAQRYRAARMERAEAARRLRWLANRTASEASHKAKFLARNRFRQNIAELRRAAAPLTPAELERTRLACHLGKHSVISPKQFTLLTGETAPSVAHTPLPPASRKALPQAAKRSTVVVRRHHVKCGSARLVVGVHNSVKRCYATTTVLHGHSATHIACAVDVGAGASCGYDFTYVHGAWKSPTFKSGDHVIVSNDGSLISCPIAGGAQHNGRRVLSFTSRTVLQPGSPIMCGGDLLGVVTESVNDLYIIDGQYVEDDFSVVPAVAVPKIKRAKLRPAKVSSYVRVLPNDIGEIAANGPPIRNADIKGLRCNGDRRKGIPKKRASKFNISIDDILERFEVLRRKHDTVETVHYVCTPIGDSRIANAVDVNPSCADAQLTTFDDELMPDATSESGTSHALDSDCLIEDGGSVNAMFINLDSSPSEYSRDVGAMTSCASSLEGERRSCRPRRCYDDVSVCTLLDIDKNAQVGLLIEHNRCFRWRTVKATKVILSTDFVSLIVCDGHFWYSHSTVQDCYCYHKLSYDDADTLGFTLEWKSVATLFYKVLERYYDYDLCGLDVDDVAYTIFEIGHQLHERCKRYDVVTPGIETSEVEDDSFVLNTQEESQMTSSASSVSIGNVVKSGDTDSANMVGHGCSVAFGGGTSDDTPQPEPICHSEPSVSVHAKPHRDWVAIYKSMKKESRLDVATTHVPKTLPVAVRKSAKWGTILGVSDEVTVRYFSGFREVTEWHSCKASELTDSTELARIVYCTGKLWVGHYIHKDCNGSYIGASCYHEFTPLAHTACDVTNDMLLRHFSKHVSEKFPGIRLACDLDVNIYVSISNQFGEKLSQSCLERVIVADESPHHELDPEDYGDVDPGASDNESEESTSVAVCKSSIDKPSTVVDEFYECDKCASLRTKASTRHVCAYFHSTYKEGHLRIHQDDGNRYCTGIPNVRLMEECMARCRDMGRECKFTKQRWCDVLTVVGPIFVFDLSFGCELFILGADECFVPCDDDFVVFNGASIFYWNGTFKKICDSNINYIERIDKIHNEVFSSGVDLDPRPNSKQRGNDVRSAVLDILEYVEDVDAHVCVRFYSDGEKVSTDGSMLVAAISRNVVYEYVDGIPYRASTAHLTNESVTSGYVDTHVVHRRRDIADGVWQVFRDGRIEYAVRGGDAVFGGTRVRTFIYDGDLRSGMPVFCNGSLICVVTASDGNGNYAIDYPISDDDVDGLPIIDKLHDGSSTIHSGRVVNGVYVTNEGYDLRWTHITASQGDVSLYYGDPVNCRQVNGNENVSRAYAVTCEKKSWRLQFLEDGDVFHIFAAPIFCCHLTGAAIAAECLNTSRFLNEEYGDSLVVWHEGLPLRCVLSDPVLVGSRTFVSFVPVNAARLSPGDPIFSGRRLVSIVSMVCDGRYILDGYHYGKKSAIRVARPLKRNEASFGIDIVTGVKKEHGVGQLSYRSGCVTDHRTRKVIGVCHLSGIEPSEGFYDTHGLEIVGNVHGNVNILTDEGFTVGRVDVDVIAPNEVRYRGFYCDNFNLKSGYPVFQNQSLLGLITMSDCNGHYMLDGHSGGSEPGKYVYARRYHSNEGGAVAKRLSDDGLVFAQEYIGGGKFTIVRRQSDEFFCTQLGDCTCYLCCDSYRFMQNCDREGNVHDDRIICTSSHVPEDNELAGFVWDDAEATKCYVLVICSETANAVVGMSDSLDNLIGRYEMIRPDDIIVEEYIKMVELVCRHCNDMGCKECNAKRCKWDEYEQYVEYYEVNRFKCDYDEFNPVDYLATVEYGEISGLVEDVQDHAIFLCLTVNGIPKLVFVENIESCSMKKALIFDAGSIDLADDNIGIDIRNLVPCLRDPKRVVLPDCAMRRTLVRCVLDRLGDGGDFALGLSDGVNGVERHFNCPTQPPTLSGESLTDAPCNYEDNELRYRPGERIRALLQVAACLSIMFPALQRAERRYGSTAGVFCLQHRQLLARRELRSCTRKNGPSFSGFGSSSGSCEVYHDDSECHQPKNDSYLSRDSFTPFERTCDSRPCLRDRTSDAQHFAVLSDDADLLSRIPVGRTVGGRILVGGGWKTGEGSFRFGGLMDLLKNARVMFATYPVNDSVALDRCPVVLKQHEQKVPGIHNGNRKSSSLVWSRGETITSRG